MKKEVIFILDESGAKGYSNNTECTLGELGVIAGYFIPVDHFDSIKKELDNIRLNFLTDGKTHIADLLPQQQEQLRNNIFSYFLQRKVFWVYEAIYVQGFFENRDFLNKLNKNSHKSRRSSIQVSWKEKRELLLAELFKGAFAKALAFCIENIGNEFKLTIITDRTDDAIVKRFQREADDFLHFGETKAHEVTGFDKETEQVFKGSITTSIAAGIEKLGDYSGISYCISCEDSALTFAADVLVNSVNYHLKSLQASELGTCLNTKNSISGHSLSDLAFGAWDDAEINWVSDAIFMHPALKNGDN